VPSGVCQIYDMATAIGGILQDWNVFADKCQFYTIFLQTDGFRTHEIEGFEERGF